MAFVIPTKRGNYEIRESHSTPDGPRSRTLAAFKELTPEAIAKARTRASKPLDVDALRAAALKAGATVSTNPTDSAARNLISDLAKGRKLDPMLKRLLRDALDDEDRRDRPRKEGATVSDSARSVSEWVGANARERGDALIDLLLLADALPLRRRSERSTFPRLHSAHP